MIIAKPKVQASIKLSAKGPHTPNLIRSIDSRMHTFSSTIATNLIRYIRLMLAVRIRVESDITEARISRAVANQNVVGLKIDLFAVSRPSVVPRVSKERISRWW